MTSIVVRRSILKLPVEQIHKIVRLQVKNLQKQLAEKHVALEVTEAAIDEIARRGYDPTFGARPLKRVIQQQIQNPLAVEMLRREFREGSGVRVDCQAGEFTFERIDATLVEAGAP